MLESQDRETNHEEKGSDLAAPAVDTASAESPIMLSRARLYFRGTGANAMTQRVPKDLEEWKPIPGHEEWYEVSSLGRVRSWKRSNVGRRDSPRLLKQRTTNKGYLYVALPSPGSEYGNRKITVHRLVSLAFLGSPKGSRVVNHIDGNRQNNSVENLEWCSPAQNNLHGFDIGTNKTHGENHHAARLTEAQVEVIIGCLQDGMSVGDLSREYNVSFGAIYNISVGKTWRRLQSKLSAEKERDDG